MNKNTLQKLGSSVKRKIVAVGTVAVATVGSAMAQTGSGNTGADKIITEISGLVPVAVAVIGAAVLVVIVPWGASMAIKAFKSIGGK